MGLRWLDESNVRKRMRENCGYFIGRSDMWKLKPDGSVCRLTAVKREIKTAEFEWRANLVEDFDPRLIMLMRHPNTEKFLASIAVSATSRARLTWRSAYRLWRAEHRPTVFPSGQQILVADERPPKHLPKIDYA